MIKFLILLFCVLIILRLYRKNRLVSSSSMWVFCYFLIFIIYPTYSSDYFDNSELIDLLALFGIIVYYIAILFAGKFSFRYGNKRNVNKYATESGVIPEFKNSFTFFCIFFSITIIVLYNILGINGLKSILDGTLTSKQLNLGDINSNPITFSMHLLVPCILCMWITSKNSKQKFVSFICLILYIIETMLFGFTRIFLITILGIVFFFEVRKFSRKKQIVVIIVGLFSLVFLLVFMNYIRSIGFSSSHNFKSILNLDFIFESTDFAGAYYYFNELLKHSSPHINPIVYLKPIFAFIPRNIWPGKPEPLSLQVLRYTNPWLAATGFSTAGNSVLGEGYAVLGYFGMYLYIFAWGFICEKLDTRYYDRLKLGYDSCLANIFYYIFAIFVVVSGQRGDWSQYMTIVIWFYFFPMLIFSKLHVKYRK